MEDGIASAGRELNTGVHRYPALELTRFAIPRSVYTEAHLDVVDESVREVFNRRTKIAGLKMIYEPKRLRFFRPGLSG